MQHSSQVYPLLATCDGHIGRVTTALSEASLPAPPTPSNSPSRSTVTMPGRGSTTHHCPLKKKGNCRKAQTPWRRPYCSAHQTYCAKCRWTYLKDDVCPKCQDEADDEGEDQDQDQGQMKGEDKNKGKTQVDVKVG
ncbi:hypothetical protein U1Q18_052147 [Sarracenia purpurea var. burkii]